MLKIESVSELKITGAINESGKERFKEELNTLFRLFTKLPLSGSKKHSTAMKLFLTEQSEPCRVTVLGPVEVSPSALREVVTLHLEDRLNASGFYLFDFIGEKHLYLRTRSQVVGVISIVQKGEKRFLSTVLNSRYSNKVVDTIKTLPL